MWSDDVVVVVPEGELPPRIVQSVEDLLIQQFIAQATVERLDEGVLLRLARIDVMPWNGILVGPSQDGPAGELGPASP